MKEIKKSANIKSKVKGKDVKFNIDLNYSPEYDSFNIKVKKGEGFMSYTDALQGLPLEVVQNLNEMLEEVLIKSGSKTEMKEHKMFDGGGFQSGVYAKGGSLIGNQKSIDMNHNGKIDAEDFKIMRTTMNGAWRNEHEHVNSSDPKQDYEVRYARKNKSDRTGYKGKTNFADGGQIESAIKGYKEYTKKNWEGYDYFSEKYAVNELAELELDLRKLNDGKLAPSKVVGGGYKNAKKVAQDWLQSQIDKQKLAIKTNGLSNYINHRNFRSYLVEAKRENIINERKFNELLDESNEIMDSLSNNFAYGGGVSKFSEYSNDALYDMIINLSRYEDTEKDIQMVKAELEKRKRQNSDIQQEIDLTDDKKLRLRNPVMPKKRLSQKEWAEKYNPRAYEFMGKRKFADGGSLNLDFRNFTLDELIKKLPQDVQFISILKNNSKDRIRIGDKEFKNYKFKHWTITDYGSMELSRGSENLYLDMKVYEASKEAPDVEYTISLYTKDNQKGLKELANNLVEKFAKGGKTEQGVDLFEDYENIPPKLQAILEKYEDAFENGDYRGLQKALEEANKIGYTFEYYLDGQAYDLRKIGEKGKSEFEEYANGGRVNKDIEINPTIKNFIHKLKKEGKYNKGNEQKNVNGVLYRFDEYKLMNPSSFMVNEFKKLVEKNYGVLSLSNGYDFRRINLEGNKVIVADLPKFKGGHTDYITFRELVILNKNGGAFEKLSNRVAKNYEGKRVKPAYQKEYGKVYSKEEAKEVGDKVAGKVKAMQKMASGGETKKGAKGGIMVLAKKIRKEGESWQDALKRAGQQLK